MILNFRMQAVALLAALCSLFCATDVSAQSFVRYVASSDLGTDVLFADSVLTSVVLPKGVYRIEGNEDIEKAALQLSDVLADKSSRLLRVYVCGSASPDGLWQDNAELSEARTNAVARYLQSATGVPAGKIHKHSLNEDWNRLYELVESSDIKYRDEILNIIKTKSWGERKRALQELGDGSVWDVLIKDFFPKMRCVRIGIYCLWEPSKPYLTVPESVKDTLANETSSASLPPIKNEATDTVSVVEAAPAQISAPIPAAEGKASNVIYIRDTVFVVKETVYIPADGTMKMPSSGYSYSARPPRVHTYYDTPWMMGFKTNLLADAMVIPSLGVEIQLADRMSLDIQGWYTPTNIFCPNKNTNVYGFTPELRWWTGKRAMSKGAFVGLHARFAWFTLQWNDGYLYQNGNVGEHSGDAGNGAPAWSLGFTYGYSLALDKKEHWGLEFLLGVGYGKYKQNLGQWNNDLQKWEFVEHQDNTHIGITRASINLTYRFSVRRVKAEYYTE